MIGLIGVVTGIRLLVNFIRDRRGRVTVNPPLLVYDQLGGNNHLESLHDDNDDDKPLPP